MVVLFGARRSSSLSQRLDPPVFANSSSYQCGKINSLSQQLWLTRTVRKCGVPIIPVFSDLGQAYKQRPFIFFKYCFQKKNLVGMFTLLHFCVLLLDIDESGALMSWCIFSAAVLSEDGGLEDPKAFVKI